MPFNDTKALLDFENFLHTTNFMNKNWLYDYRGALELNRALLESAQLTHVRLLQLSNQGASWEFVVQWFISYSRILSTFEGCEEALVSLAGSLYDAHRIAMLAVCGPRALSEGMDGHAIFQAAQSTQFDQLSVVMRLYTIMKMLKVDVRLSQLASGLAAMPNAFYEDFRIKIALLDHYEWYYFILPSWLLKTLDALQLVHSLNRGIILEVLPYIALAFSNTEMKIYGVISLQESMEALQPEMPPLECHEILSPTEEADNLIPVLDIYQGAGLFSQAYNPEKEADQFVKAMLNLP